MRRGHIQKFRYNQLHKRHLKNENIQTQDHNTETVTTKCVGTSFKVCARAIHSRMEYGVGLGRFSKSFLGDDLPSDQLSHDLVAATVDGLHL